MNKLLVVLGVLTFALVFTGMFWWLRGPTTTGKDAKPFTHIHCPDCGLEARYTSGMENRSCPHCGTSGPKMVPTVGPYKESFGADGGTTATGAGLAAATIALVLVQGWLYGWVLFARARRRAQESLKNQPLVCRCPFCSRKIGYLPRKIGTATVCSRCKTTFTLPDVGIALEEAP